MRKLCPQTRSVTLRQLSKEHNNTCPVNALMCSFTVSQNFTHHADMGRPADHLLLVMSISTSWYCRTHVWQRFRAKRMTNLESTMVVNMQPSLHYAATLFICTDIYKFVIICCWRLTKSYHNLVEFVCACSGKWQIPFVALQHFCQVLLCDAKPQFSHLSSCWTRFSATQVQFGSVAFDTLSR